MMEVEWVIAMPTDNLFWRPVHEAGHAVLAVNITGDFHFALVNVRTGFGYTEVTSEQGRIEDSKQIDGFIKVIAGGIAAEYLVNEKERHLAVHELEPATLERSRSDRETLRKAINVDAMLRGYGIRSEDQLILEIAKRNVVDLIEKNTDLFSKIRIHLAEFRYIGPRGMKKLKSEKSVSKFDHFLDYRTISYRTISQESPHFRPPVSRVGLKV